MINFDFELLFGIGLSDTLARRARDAADGEPDDGNESPLALMRVTAVHRTTVQVHDGRVARAARVLPRLLRGDDGADAIAVGDWVLVGAATTRDLRARGGVAPSSPLSL
jgi:ribosome biogenesis GTPase